MTLLRCDGHPEYFCYLILPLSVSPSISIMKRAYRGGESTTLHKIGADSAARFHHRETLPGQHEPRGGGLEFRPCRATHPLGPITGMELIAVREVARQAVKTTLMAEIRTLIEGRTP